MQIHDFTVNTLNGKQESLSIYKDKVVLIVNTASKCGLTPQYKELQELYNKYSEQGLEILGFPCNQFGNQEKGSSDEIESFCSLNYGVTFPMFEKINVNGEHAHPLYKYLCSEAPGLLGLKAIKWNFTKFLIDREGNVVERFSPQTVPSKLTSTIEGLL